MASEAAEPHRVPSEESDECWDMKKHASSAFKQQRLPAWSPILSPTTVLPYFLITGALLIPAGVGLLFLSESVREYGITYTYCPQYFEENGTFGQRNCAEVIAETNETCQCAYNFSLPRTVESPVFIYYQLSNYHQNHRRYVNSRDDHQLSGELHPRVSPYCAPFDYDEDGRPIERGPDSVDAHRGALDIPQAVPPRRPQRPPVRDGLARRQLHSPRRVQLPGDAIPRREEVHRDVDDGDGGGEPVPGRGLRGQRLPLHVARRRLRRAAPALPPSRRAHGQRRTRDPLPLKTATAPGSQSCKDALHLSVLCGRSRNCFCDRQLLFKY